MLFQFYDCAVSQFCFCNWQGRFQFSINPSAHRVNEIRCYNAAANKNHQCHEEKCPSWQAGSIFLFSLEHEVLLQLKRSASAYDTNIKQHIRSQFFYHSSLQFLSEILRRDAKSTFFYRTKPTAFPTFWSNLSQFEQSPWVISCIDISENLWTLLMTSQNQFLTFAKLRVRNKSFWSYCMVSITSFSSNMSLPFSVWRFSCFFSNHFLVA